VYTRPEIYKNIEVPDVLLSGNHQKIDEWKKNNLKDI
jgi:tRNA (guanine37-N1)-methyltransferase